MTNPPQLPDLSERIDYEWGTLDEADTGVNPVELLSRWMNDARDSGIADFNAMVLATVGDDGQPTARNVLLRALEPSGELTFFTNLHSRKGTEILNSARVGILFSWLSLHRQVHVDGVAIPVNDSISDDYFAGRPRGSRLAAWASAQSEVIDGRATLDAAMKDMDERFSGVDVPRPPYWGGYGVTPHLFEFWQGRPSRLHDRIRYRTSVDGWERDRLAP